MQTCRLSTRLPRAVIRPKNLRVTSTIPTRNMSFFRTTPSSIYNAEPTFHPLFRLLDDFDNYSRGSQVEGQGNGTHRAHVKTFTPKFDLKETESAYELHGELPGISKENVNIEFTDPQTIVVRGRVERSYTAGTPPAGQLEGTKMSGAITEGGEAPSKPHRATVEDENEAQGAEVAKADPQQQQKAQDPKVKYWVSERSVGEFSRSFSFPTRIEADEVKAGLDNGILTVSVPKAKKHESRRIAIS